MSNENELRLGIVGCGGISHAHGVAAKNIPEKIRFVACCDIYERRAREWAARYGCERIYSDYREMISKEDLDGVLLATWPTQHTDQIKECLAAGARNILCEKALTLRGKEAMEIWKSVETSDAFVMEGFMYRHHPAIHKLDDILASKKIGQVDSVRAVSNAYDAENAAATDSTRNWRQRKECGGGVPYDFACYTTNACTHFARGIPKRVFSMGGVSKKYDTVNRLYGIIEYDNGCIGIIESSTKVDFNQELQISCSRGILNLPIAWTICDEITIEKRRRESWAHFLTDTYTIEKADAYQLQLENFVEVIRGKAQPLLPLIDSVLNTFLIEALVTSMLDKRIVDINLPDVLMQALAETREV